MKRLFFLLAISALFFSCKKDNPKPNLLTYIANAEQSNENPPAVYVLENTIGNIHWTYVSVGVYHGILPKSYEKNNIHVVCNNGVDGYISSDLRVLNETTIELRTFSGLEEFGPIPSNGCSNISFEIKIKN